MPNSQYPDVPRPGVLAVLVREESVLLVKRRFDPDAGKWGFPGGKQQLGETVAEAALRELLEETGVRGCNPRVLTILDAIDRQGPDPARPRYHYTLAVMLLEYAGGDPVASDDAEEAAWVSESELHSLSLCRQVMHVRRLALDMLFAD